MKGKLSIQQVLLLSPYIGVYIGMYIFSNAFLALGIYHIGIISALIIKKKKTHFTKLLSIKNKKLFIAASAISLLSGLALYSSWNLIKIPEVDLSETLLQLELNDQNIWIFLIYFSTINPLLEELFWRFQVKSTSKNIINKDILFAGYHALVLVRFVRIEYVIVSVIALIIISWTWRYLHRVRKENLLIITTHALADFSIMLSTIILSNTI